MCCFTLWYYGSTHIEPSYLSTRRTLLCVLCNKAWCLLRPDIPWFFANTLIWYHAHKHIHAKTHNTLCGQYWHINISNTYQHRMLCAHNSYTYYIQWIIHWYQNLTFHNVLSFQKLLTYRSHISDDLMQVFPMKNK